MDMSSHNVNARVCFGKKSNIVFQYTVCRCGRLCPSSHVLFHKLFVGLVGVVDQILVSNTLFVGIQGPLVQQTRDFSCSGERCTGHTLSDGRSSD